MKPGGAAASAAVLGETARRAATQARIDLPTERAVVAAAGAGRAQEQAELAAALIHGGLARHVRVMADGEVALSTAFPDGTGILVNAGTGSIAYARDPGGQVHRVGGYGWQLGDEGGGYWLGRRALDGAARAQDGRGEGSTLLARLLGALGLQTFDDLMRWTATATPAQVAALAPHVLNAARDGEVVAQRAVDDAARELPGACCTPIPPSPTHSDTGSPRNRSAPGWCRTPWIWPSARYSWRPSGNRVRPPGPGAPHR